jgi:hypothetical protein
MGDAARCQQLASDHGALHGRRLVMDNRPHICIVLVKWSGPSCALACGRSCLALAGSRFTG